MKISKSFFLSLFFCSCLFNSFDSEAAEKNSQDKVLENIKNLKFNLAEKTNTPLFTIRIKLRFKPFEIDVEFESRTAGNPFSENEVIDGIVKNGNLILTDKRFVGASITKPIYLGQDMVKALRLKNNVIEAGEVAIGSPLKMSNSSSSNNNQRTQIGLHNRSCSGFGIKCITIGEVSLSGYEGTLKVQKGNKLVGIFKKDQFDKKDIEELLKNGLKLENDYKINDETLKALRLGGPRWVPRDPPRSAKIIDENLVLPFD